MDDIIIISRPIAYGYCMSVVQDENYGRPVNIFILNSNLSKAESIAEEAELEYYEELKAISEPGIDYTTEPGEEAAMREVYNEAYRNALYDLAIYTEEIEYWQRYNPNYWCM